MKSYRGFTLVELLVSVVLFATILGALFTVTSSVRKTEKFREDNTVLTQNASYAFEPIVDAIKSGDAIVCVQTASQNEAVRGFYSGQVPSLVDNSLLNSPVHTITTVGLEKIQDNAPGQSNYQLVKRIYSLDTDPTTNNGIITESTYTKSPANYTVPSDCNTVSDPWSGITPQTRTLTSNDVSVSQFSVWFISPLVRDITPTSSPLSAPFARIVVTVAPAHASQTNLANPVTLQTTITPTFSYGVRHD